MHYTHHLFNIKNYPLRYISSLFMDKNNNNNKQTDQNNRIFQDSITSKTMIHA